MIGLILCCVLTTLMTNCTLRSVLVEPVVSLKTDKGDTVS